MADVEVQQPVRETTPSSLQAPIIEKRIIRMRSPSPSFRARSKTPIRGRSVTPLQLFREKSATPSAWRSITPFISREDKEKTPFEIGPNIIQQLASYKAIIDKALVMDISLEEEAPAKYIISEQSVIDKAAVMDLSNVEIIYVEDDDYDESDYRESESPASTIGTDDREKTAELTAGSDDEQQPEKKKKSKKGGKKVTKKKGEKKEKEKEDTPPRLKLDMDPPKPKVSKAKMFEQSQKAAEEKPLDKPPPKKKGGKLTGALAAMKAEEAKMKEAEDQKKQIEEKMKRMKAEQEAKKEQAAQEKVEAAEAEAAENENDDEERGSDDEGGSQRGSDDEHSGMFEISLCDFQFSIIPIRFKAMNRVLVRAPAPAPSLDLARAKKKKTRSWAKRSRHAKRVRRKTILRDRILKTMHFGRNSTRSNRELFVRNTNARSTRK